MTTVIARRVFDYKTNGRKRRVLVEVGRPRRDPKGPDWYCPYRITGVRKPRIFGAYGIDEMQALILCLAALSQEITEWGKRDPALTWFGDRFLGLYVHAVLRAEGQRTLDEAKRRGVKVPKAAAAALRKHIRSLP